MGDDTIYSGTVAAATEGYLLGIPSVAISLASKTAAHFETAAGVALELLERHDAQPAGRVAAQRQRARHRRATRCAGYRITRLGRRHKAEDVIQAQNPRGETVYWVGAAGAAADAGEGTDFHAVEQRLRIDDAAADRPDQSRPDGGRHGVARSLTCGQARRGAHGSRGNGASGIGMTSDAHARAHGRAAARPRAFATRSCFRR